MILVIELVIDIISKSYNIKTQSLLCNYKRLKTSSSLFFTICQQSIQSNKKSIWAYQKLLVFNQKYWFSKNKSQKQLFRGVFEKSCSGNIQQLASNFIEITLRYGCSPVNLLHIFRIAFLKNTSEWLLPKSEVHLLYECLEAS